MPLSVYTIDMLQVPSTTDVCINFKLLEKLSVRSRTPVFAKVYEDEERGNVNCQTHQCPLRQALYTHYMYPDAYCAVPYSVDKDKKLTLVGCSKNLGMLCECAASNCTTYFVSEMTKVTRDSRFLPDSGTNPKQNMRGLPSSSLR